MNKLDLSKCGTMIAGALTTFAKAAEKRDVRIHEAFTLAYDMAVAAKIPKTEAGVKEFRAAVQKAITQNEKIVNLAIGSGYGKGTLGQYASGLYRAYVAGVAWTPDSHSKAPAFPWKKKEEKPDAGEAGTGAAADKAKSAKPGKVESVTIDAVRAEATQFLTHLRMLGFSDVAEKVLDAIIASPLKPTPPASK